MTNYHHSVFLDDTALKAFMNPDDPSYIKARNLFLELDDLDRQLVTTNYVIFDTHQWLRDHYGYTSADYFLNTIEKSVSKDKLAVISGNPEFERKARQLLIERPDCGFSLNEALTAVVLITYQIKRIFTFNPGFSLIPHLDGEIKPIPGIL
ncbi:type II toxin-antitoxin system VapC family toxin [Ferviditalea candida]|uniref:PIN domain-containing protein n=1 Tax=Ferviditalea candida TaxID=3108399 RepID=A0ABU5ZJT4_9BACL|nr:hypothetical protein [Paenibacillaceae bacterium T2]